jgi:hypothetical protein
VRCLWAPTSCLWKKTVTSRAWGSTLFICSCPWRWSQTP